MTRLRCALFGLLAGVIAALVLLDTAPDYGPGTVHEHGTGLMMGVRAALAQTVAFLFTFDGAPVAPQAWAPTTWDVQVHHNGQEWWRQFPPTVAQHGANCSAPPATHTATTHEQAVFVCNNHIMTVIEAGYGVIYLTPDQLVDFATGEAVVRFDMSTLRTSTRDWVDLWVTPYEDNLALPLDEGQDLNGPPRRAVHLKMGWGGSTYFGGTVFRDFSPNGLTLHNVGGIENVLTPSAAQREPFELRLSRTRVRFGLPNRNMWWVDQTIPDLGWTRGVIQLGHHTYIAEKGCIQFNPSAGGYDGAPEQSCPNTWHWDNVSISPAVPFTILRANRRYVDSTTPQGVTFPSPAPSGAHLRFGGIGSGIQVSFNGGSAWQSALKQAQQGAAGDSAFGSYWTPIPAGTAQVLFRKQNGTSGWLVKDISIFAAGASTSPPPPPPVVCSPRPKVTTSVVKESPGVLRATISATGANNTISRIDFVPRDAIVRRAGFADQTGSFSLTPQTVSTTFQILQRVPGAAATVQALVTDACTTTPTFVGGGPAAF